MADTDERRPSSGRTAPAPSLLGGVLAAASLGAAAFIALLLWSFSAGAAVCGPGCVDRRLDDLADANGAIPADRLPLARELVSRQLSFSPVDVSAWLRLAALDAQIAGGMNAEAVQALETSYRYAPVDATVARWRLAFMFEHWNGLPAGLRGAAVREIQGLLVSPANIHILRDLEPSITNPSGRLACALLRRTFERTGG